MYIILYLVLTSVSVFYLLFKKYQPLIFLIYKYVTFRLKEFVSKDLHKNIRTYENVVEKFDNYMTISYFDSDDNKMRKVYLPLQMDNVLAMNECKIEAFYSDDNEEINQKRGGEKIITIKQDPEIPVMVTAGNMGANYILVHNLFNGEEKIFRGDQKVECFTAD
jgi:hypothetical protein